MFAPRRLSENLDIEIHPKILNGSNAGALWLLCRSHDKQSHINGDNNPKLGSGKASFTIPEIQSALGFCKSTIFRWMKSNLFYSKKEICANNPNIVLKKRNQFITHKNENGETVYTLYYKSIAKVKDILDIQCLGYRVFGDFSHISKYLRKLTAFEIIAEAVQTASAKAVKANRGVPVTRRTKNNPNKPKPTSPQKPLLDPKSVFDGINPTSSNCGNRLQTPTKGVKSNQRLVLVNTDHVDVIGVSQTKIGEIIGRHRTTASRHLKAKTHKAIYITNKSLTETVVAEFSSTGKQYLVDSKTGRVYFKFGNTVYRKYTNLYKEDWIVFPYDCKNLSKEVIQNCNVTDDTKLKLTTYKTRSEIIQDNIQKEYKYTYFNSNTKTTKFGKFVLSEYDPDKFLVSTWKLRNKLKKLHKVRNTKVIQKAIPETYSNLFTLQSIIDLLQEFVLTQEINSNSRMGSRPNNGYRISNLRKLGYNYNTYESNIDSSILKHHTIITDMLLFSKYVYSVLVSNSNKMTNSFYSYLELYFKNNFENINELLSSAKKHY